MIVFIREYYDQDESHFNDRYEERVTPLDLNDKQKEILDTNFKEVDKLRHYFKNSSLGFRLLQFSKQPREIYDSKNTLFYGNELWVIIKNGKFVTVVIRSNDEMNDKRRAKKSMRVERVAYGTNDLKKMVEAMSRKP